MRPLRPVSWLLILTAVVAAPLAAQQTGTFEIGAFGQAAYFDRTLRFDQGSGGVGARLGFFLLPALEIEAEGGFVPTDVGLEGRVEYFPIRGNLTLNLRTGQHTSILVGGGYVHNEYRRDVDGSDDGATAHAGVRLGLPGLPSIRLGTYVDYIPSPQNGAGENWNWGVQVGLSSLLGKGAPREGRDDEVATPPPDSIALAAERDSLAAAARADSLARARADSARAAAARDSVAQAQRDSVARVEEQQRARAQAVRDSLLQAGREDSLQAVALRERIRATRNEARLTALRDSLQRVALRDSLRILIETPESRVTLRGVNFEINKATLLPISREILQDVARTLLVNPEVTVEVAGHTDNTGPRALNDSLSQARAEAVKTFLIENGVAAERMTTRGYAWDQPVASNRTASGRAQNRRTELRRTD